MPPIIEATTLLCETTALLSYRFTWEENIQRHQAYTAVVNVHHSHSPKVSADYGSVVMVGQLLSCTFSILVSVRRAAIRMARALS